MYITAYYPQNNSSVEKKMYSYAYYPQNNVCVDKLVIQWKMRKENRNSKFGPHYDRRSGQISLNPNFGVIWWKSKLGNKTQTHRQIDRQTDRSSFYIDR